MQSLRVGILMGGLSIEREVSLNSGRTICDHLDTSRYELLPIFQTHTGALFVLPWRFLHRGKISDFEHRLEGEAERISWDDLKTRVDFVFIALHGRYGEDGSVQGFLEVLKIPYFGSKVLASSLGMNKAVQKIVLSGAGITTPKGFVVNAHECETISTDTLLDQFSQTLLSFPVIVKPVHEGSSLGVTKVKNIETLSKAIHKASTICPGKKQAVIVEEVINGMEFSCIIITDPATGELTPLPPTEIEIETASLIFDYDQKYMPGRATKHTPARCSCNAIKLIQDTSIKTMKALGFTNLGRIDGFLQADGTICITDPNSFSGMSPSSYAFLQAAEVDMTHTGLINHLIETELRAYGILNAESEYHNSFEKKESFVSSSFQKIRVGVLLGGASNEREISLESGRNVCYKLSPAKYEVTPLFVSSKHELFPLTQRLLVRNKTEEIEELTKNDPIIPWSKLPELFDFIFIGLHGGVGENGSVQGTLEMLKMPYNGSPVLPSALCMDKYRTNELLASCHIDIPRHVLISKDQWMSTLHECPLSFPVVIKPHDDGCSVLVQRADNKIEFELAIETIFASQKEYALVEELIVGTEVTVGVLGNERPFALPPSQSIAAKGILSIEEKFLPGAGENQTPAQLPLSAIKLIQKTVEAAYCATNCKGYARIDCFYQNEHESPTGKERVIIIEINTLPGLTPATCIFHQAAELGIKPMDFIDLIIQLGFELHTQQPHLNKEQQTFLQQEN